MIETNVLMTVTDFSGFFSRNHFLEGSFTFQWGGGGGGSVAWGFIFKWGDTPWGASVLIEGVLKKIGGTPPLWETLTAIANLISLAYIGHLVLAKENYPCTAP